MAILAFDTCLGSLSVALRYRTAGGDWLVREAYESRQTGHAERLMPMIAEVMSATGCTFSDIERFAVTVGPGTFTGVRVGIAAARAFSLAARRPVVGATSLEIMAARGRHLLGADAGTRPLLVATDARRGALYCALHDPTAGEAMVQEPAAPELLTIEAAVARAQDHQALVIGSGGPLMVAAAASSGIPLDTALPELEPHARFLAQLAVARTPASTLAPLYLRAPDVKPQPAPVARQP